MLNLFLKAFGLVFLAEMGDKTQLSTLGLASSAGKTAAHPALAIFLGSAFALVCTSAVAALGGAWISEHVNLKYVRMASGALFIVFGVICLRDAFVSR